LGYYEAGFRGLRRYCAVCGLGFYEEEMVRQNGVWKCYTSGPRCFDETDEDD
jgi:hypothetical protein